MLKINIDGAYIASTGKAGVGVVVRGFCGRLQLVEAIPILSATSAELVEDLGFHFAILTATKYGTGDFILEGMQRTSFRCYK